ncbi:MAG: M16 family metallopeptidase, partial [Thermoguttaceae bacterium]
TASRSNSMTRDWYHLGRVRSLEELMTAIDALSLDQINDFIAKNPPNSFHCVTLGGNTVR